MPDSNQERAIGRLEGRIDGVDDKLESIERLLKEQNVASSESRAALYDRVGAIETDIKISASVDAQVRERLDKFDAKLTTEVMPTIDEVRRWKITGVTVLAMVGMGGAAIGTFFWWAKDVIIDKWNGAP